MLETELNVLNLLHFQTSSLSQPTNLVVPVFLEKYQ